MKKRKTSRHIRVGTKIESTLEYSPRIHAETRANKRSRLKIEKLVQLVAFALFRDVVRAVVSRCEVSKPVLRGNVAFLRFFPYSRLFVVTSRVTGGRQRIPKGGFGTIAMSSSSCMRQQYDRRFRWHVRSIRESQFAHEGKLRHSASRGEMLSKEKYFLC